jgi:hypothetical protein
LKSTNLLISLPFGTGERAHVAHWTGGWVGALTPYRRYAEEKFLAVTGTRNWTEGFKQKKKKKKKKEENYILKENLIKNLIH